MKKPIGFLEQSAFRSFWNDGLLDVMLGLAILLVGISWWQDAPVLGILFLPIAVSLWHPIRKKLVEPRMGFVEFSGSREIKARSFRYGLASFFAGTMLLGVLIYSLWNNEILPKPAEWVGGFPLVLTGIPAVFFALFTGCKRFSVYGLIMFVSAIELVILGREPHEGLIACGVIILISGLVILTRFITRYPVPTDDPS